MILNKILAVYVGPAGYAAIGQFQNAIAIGLSLGGGVMAPGVTKMTAEHYEDAPKQHAIWRTGAMLTLVGTAIASGAFFLLGPWLAVKLLQRADMASVFAGLAIALPAIAINNVLLAITNGKKDVTTYVSANIIGSLLSLLIVGVLTYGLGLYGALLALAISPAAVAVGTACLLARRSWIRPSHLWGKFDMSVVRELSSFGAMGLTAALTAPLTYIYIREFLSGMLGLPAAGYWQASWKISEIYLMLITLTLSMYYLPRLAEIKLAAELRAEIINVYRVVLPVVISGAVIIFMLRDFIIHMLFSGDFSPMRALFPWQLTGDVLKIGSWILSFVMLGRAMVKSFIVTEIIFSASFCLLTHAFVLRYGLAGVSMAYALNYFCYWIVMSFLVKSEIKKMESEKWKILAPQ